jgi:uncharacterized membrane protein
MMTDSRVWVVWFTLLFGVLSIAFSKRLGRNAVKQVMWTRFMPPGVAIFPERRRLEEERHRRVFIGAGVFLIIVSLLALARVYSASN